MQSPVAVGQTRGECHGGGPVAEAATHPTLACREVYAHRVGFGKRRKPPRRTRKPADAFDFRRNRIIVGTSLRGPTLSCGLPGPAPPEEAIFLRWLGLLGAPPVEPDPPAGRFQRVAAGTSGSFPPVRHDRHSPSNR